MNDIEEKKQALIDILNDICDHAMCTRLTRCKDCRSFAEVTPNSYQRSIRVCIKGHNGYETFGCTEGEPKNVQD